MEEQFKGLVEDFTQMNVNLNEYKGRVYDLEKKQKMYQKQVKELQTQVNSAEKDLRKKNMTIKKSKEKGALESLMEENDNQREQILVLKNSLRSLHEAQQAAKEEAAESAERGGAQGNEDDGDSSGRVRTSAEAPTGVLRTGPRGHTSIYQSTFEARPLRR